MTRWWPFRKRRTFTIRNSEIWIDGRKATKEEARECVKTMESVERTMVSLSASMEAVIKKISGTIRRAAANND